MKKYIIIGVVVIAAAVVAVILLWRRDLSGKIVIPYIAHQKPYIDPHLPDYNPLSDKLDEVLFDGLFNISANPSGITYEDGLGQLIGIDNNNVVTVRLKTNQKWHSSFIINQKDDKVQIQESTPQYFTAEDLQFTLNRIQRLGSLSPDYILTSQALQDYNFTGPDQNNDIRFQFKGDRIWVDADIKEVLSFKILPKNSDLNARNYLQGTGPYMAINKNADVTNFVKNPAGQAYIPNLILEPFIDNSTFTTEFKNNKINVLPSTPFGTLSPILAKAEKYFTKSNISTTYFALFFNTMRLERSQRKEIRNLINRQLLQNRFFKIGSEQQRHIVDYKGNRDNYQDYLNYSIFPSTSYYIEEDIVTPDRQIFAPDLHSIPDTVRIAACMNYGFREEYRDLIEILNDPTLFAGKLKVTAVQNEDIRRGNYDALLIALTGYRSTFLFDLYDIFLRQPDLETYRINLQTSTDAGGEKIILPTSLQADNNFFRMNASVNSAEQQDILTLLNYIYGFMSTREIGDKQVYARYIDQSEHEMALGVWLFSLPSLAYFSTQFDAQTIDLYGVASQFSTIEKWQERKEK
jgi:hypothetical protein